MLHPSSSAGGNGEKERASHDENENCPSSSATEVTDRVTQGQQGRAWDCNLPAKETVGGKTKGVRAGAFCSFGVKNVAKRRMSLSEELESHFSATPYMVTDTSEDSVFRIRTNISSNGTGDGAWAAGSTEDMIAICTIGAILSLMCVIGVTGNVYTLLVMCHYLRSSASMYIYIINLALADLLYLLTIPFIVGTYFIQKWYFGDVGCRILFSLDFLTMHASIFTLTVMSTERYFAVLKPLDTVKRSKSYRKAIAVVIWLVSLLLTLPMLIMIQLVQRDNKSICLPTWSKLSYKVYLTILFGTSIVGPGVVIGYLYIRLAKIYWVSQTASFKQTKRLPNQKTCPRQHKGCTHQWTDPQNKLILVGKIGNAKNSTEVTADVAGSADQHCRSSHTLWNWRGLNAVSHCVTAAENQCNWHVPHTFTHLPNSQPFALLIKPRSSSYPKHSSMIFIQEF
ncbi:hypothetical protein IHE44_0006764 [Lamprotornis superbus]|uniref:Urotensin-2 receptor n=1 Tax=Lamprotornis superbus TaxID=245042 RepID=A0A835TQ08_9PASS|nr:hypothetical protein IHE44_0006764 [Lamprotornis superbus]